MPVLRDRGKKLREIQTEIQREGETERDRERERQRAIKENCLKRILKVNSGSP